MAKFNGKDILFSPRVTIEASYTAGDGLTLSNNEFSIETRFYSILAACADNEVFAKVAQIQGAEASANKVKTLSASSTDNQYPTAKCVYQMIGNVEAALEALL